MSLPKSKVPDMPENPTKQWKRLSQHGHGGGRLEVPNIETDVDAGHGKALWALGPDDEPRLLIPIGNRLVAQDLGESRNLRVGVSNYVLDDRSMCFIDLMVLDKRLSGVFADLAIEALERVANGESAEKAVSGTISDFRQLLERPPSVEVELSTVIGLLGELLVLERLSEESPEAVSTWMGPWEQRHDFRRGSRAIEVKTSIRADAHAVTIHGEEQLEAPAGGDMMLVHMKLERTVGGRETVERVVERIAAQGADADRLNEGLKNIGCSNSIDPAWNSTAFNVEKLDIYQVRNAFPRITSASFPGGSLPDGVSDLTYEIDLGAAANFRLSETDHEIVFRRFME